MAELPLAAVSGGAPVNLDQLRQELSKFQHALLKELRGSLQQYDTIAPAGTADPMLLGAGPTPDPKSPAVVSVGPSVAETSESSQALKLLQELDQEEGGDPEWKDRHLSQELSNPQHLLDRFCMSSKKAVNETTCIDDEPDQQRRKPKLPPAPGAFSELGESKRTDLATEEYIVENLYHRTGLVQAIACSHIFDQVSLTIICINAVYIGVDANTNTEGVEKTLIFELCDHFFCVFFTGEILIRFGAFRNKCDCLRDNWFRFDSLLVVLMIFETWIVPILFHGLDLPTAPLRLLRLFRLARLVRLLRSFPELITMFKGMAVASRAVISSLFLLLIIIYVFGIVVHMVLSSEDIVADRFATLPRCMWTLMMDGVFMDSTGDVFTMFFRVDDAVKCIISTLIMLVFIGISAITVMNMLIGILCEVVSTVAQNERDDVAIRLMKNSILQELKRFDKNGDGHISKEELDRVMQSDATLEALGTLDIDVECLHQLQEALFKYSEISIEDIMELLLSYRGNLPCTVKHLLDAQVFTRWSFAEEIHSIKSHLDTKFMELAQVLAMLIQRVLHTESLANTTALQSMNMHNNVLTALSEYFPHTETTSKLMASHIPMGKIAGELKKTISGMVGSTSSSATNSPAFRVVLPRNPQELSRELKETL